jgi:hypothetical protein
MALQKKKIEGGGGRVPLIDPSTHYAIVLDSEHHEVHDGAAYKLGARSSDISATPVHLSFTTPDSIELQHLVADAYAVDAALLTITEAPTGGVTGGTAVTPINRRRDSTNTSGITGALSGATAPTGGTVFPVEDLGAAAFGPGGIPGASRDAREWVLKPDTLYSFRLTGASGVGNLTLRWYEHSDKD